MSNETDDNDGCENCGADSGSCDCDTCPNCYENTNWCTCTVDPEPVDPDKTERFLAAATQAGVQAFVSEPTCCKGCTVIPDHIDQTLPYLWVFISDDTLNDSSYWQNGNTVGHIGYEPPTDPDTFEAWAANITAALTEHRFTATAPANPSKTFTVN